MKAIPVSLLALCGIFLVGCMPIERFWWSPEGDRAIVIQDRMLHLVDGPGELRSALSMNRGDASRAFFDGVDWFANGDRFVVQRIRFFDEWRAARPNLPTTEAERIEELARGIPNLLVSAILVGGDAEQPGKLLERISGAPANLLQNAFSLALQTQPAQTRKALRDAPKSLAAFEKNRGDIEGFFVHEIVSVDLSGAKEGREEILVGTSETVQSPTVSPQGNAIAYVRKQERDNLYSIEVLTTDGGRSATVAKGAHDAFAWTDDGSAIVLMAPATNEGILKQIKKITVFGESGELLARKNRKTMNLATAVVPFAPRIEKLSGDGILFASQSGGLPVSSSETPYEANLYRVSADGGPVERVPTSPGALPMNLGFFVVSPNGGNVAVVESDTDAVAVVDVKTGRSKLVSPAHANWRCRTLPAWKSNDELTFAALDTSSETIEWKRWSREGKVVTLSRGWPDEATADWLEKKEDDR